MEMGKMHMIATCIKRMGELTDCEETEVIDSLTGTCFDEEDAGDIKAHLENIVPM